MARDKLITVRIEGEKRQAFGDLAKSQNTDTASLLYDFISGCLDGTIDIGIVTGKGNRIDKLDNQIGSDRLDKLEANTQEIDNRLDTISKKLTDWIEAFDDRLNDCDQGLSNKMISLEHRLNALAMQLDSQQDSQQIDSIDTDSQKDRQGENPDIETVATVEIADTVEAVDTVESVDDNVETADSVEPVSIDEPDKGAIGPVTGDSPQPKNQLSEGMNAAEAFRYATTKGVKVSEKTLSDWISKKKHIPMTGKGDAVSEYLVMRHGLYYPNPDQP